MRSDVIGDLHDPYGARGIRQEYRSTGVAGVQKVGRDRSERDFRVLDRLKDPNETKSEVGKDLKTVESSSA